MAGISYIKRITGSSNPMVHIITSDSTATAIAASYITNQASNIISINNSIASQPFQWMAGDNVLLQASDGDSWCVTDYNSSTGVVTKLTSFSSSINSEVLSVPFTLTLAQFTGMYATPVQVVPAPGAGLLAIPETISLELVYGSAALTLGGAVGFQYGNSAHLAGTVCTNQEQATDFTGATANTVYNFITATGNGSQILASNANTAIYISNATAAFATGTGSSFKGIAKYRLLAV